MPKTSKLTPEEKMCIVQRCLKGEIGINEASRVVGVAKISIQRWIMQYQTEGASAFLPRCYNRAYDGELKKQAVEECLVGGISLFEICKKYKIRNEAILIQWIKVYNAHGDFNSRNHSEGGSYMKQGRKTTEEERVQIAKECIAANKNYGALALKYRVSYQQVYRWTQRYEALGKAGLEDRRGQRKKTQTPRTELEQAQIEIEQLKHRLYLTEMERDLLKKLNEVVRGDVYHK